METNSGITKLKRVGYVAATVGIVLNLAMFDALLEEHQSIYVSFFLILAG